MRTPKERSRRTEVDEVVGIAETEEMALVDVATTDGSNDVVVVVCVFLGGSPGGVYEEIVVDVGRGKIHGMAGRKRGHGLRVPRKIGMTRTWDKRGNSY
jgi:hypothetical protein